MYEKNVNKNLARCIGIYRFILIARVFNYANARAHDGIFAGVHYVDLDSNIL